MVFVYYEFVVYNKYIFNSKVGYPSKVFLLK